MRRQRKRESERALALVGAVLAVAFVIFVLQLTPRVASLAKPVTTIEVRR